MAFPTVLTRGNAQSSADTTSPAFTHPSVDAGDRVVLCVFKDGEPPISAFGSLDWKVIEEILVGTSNRGYVLWRDCDGTEDGSTITFTGDSQNYGFRWWVLDAGTFNPNIPPRVIPLTGSAANANPAALTPAWGSVDTLYLVYLGLDGQVTVSGTPASYSDTGSAPSTDTTPGDRITHAWGEREVNGTTTDPGAFTHASAAYIVFTIAIAPADAVATTPHLLGLQRFRSSSQTPSLSCVVPAAAQLAIADFCGYNGGTISMSSGTLGGVSRDSIVQETGGAESFGAGRMVWANPLTGARTLAPGWSAAPNSLGGAEYVVTYWNHVDAASPIRDDGTTQGPGSFGTVTATTDSASTDAVICFAGVYNGSGAVTADSASQFRVADSGYATETTALLIREVAPGASSTTLECDGSNISLVATSIKYAALPGGGSTLTADTAAFTLTGVANALVHGYQLSADPGSVALTGTTTGLARGYRLAADAATFVLSGTANSLIHGYRLTADAGSFALSGAAATLVHGYRLTADAGELELSGTDAELRAARSLVADAATLALTGTDAALVADLALDAGEGAYSLSGQGAALLHGYTLTAEEAAFEVTSEDAALLALLKLDAEPATFTLTGTDAGLAAGRVLDAESGSIELTGSTAALVHGYTLAAEAGTFGLDGTDAELLAGRAIVADPASFALTGDDVELVYDADNRVSAQPAEFEVVGTDAELRVARMLAAESATLSLEGTDASLARDGTLAADPGELQIVAPDASLAAARNIAADETALELTGNVVALRRDATVAAAGAAYTLTGEDSGFARGLVMAAAAAALLIAGSDADLVFGGRRLAADAATFALTRTPATLTAALVPSVPGRASSSVSARASASSSVTLVSSASSSIGAVGSASSSVTGDS